MVFGLLSLSLLLFPQRFARYVPQPSSVRIEPATSRWLPPWKLREPTSITVTLCVLLASNNTGILVMVNGIRTGHPSVLTKGRSSKFRVDSRIRQTPEGRRTYRPKRCRNDNKNEDNSPKTRNDKNIKFVFISLHFFFFSFLFFLYLFF